MTEVSRFFKLLFTYIATLCLVGACFGIIWGLNVAKLDLNKDKQETGSGVVKFVSFIIAFVIIIINTMLKSVVRLLSAKERHETYTAYNLSVAFKLAVVRFVNTAIVPVVVNSSSEKWFIDGGLVSDIFSIMISISFIDPIMYIVDPGNFIRKLKRWLQRSKGENCLLTQAEANE